MSETQGFLRFRRTERIEHWLLFTSFTTLAITGLIQKFAEVGLSQFLIAVLGGIELVRIIHRIAATLLMFETIYHIGAVGYKVFVQRAKMSMLPDLSDLRNAWQLLRYNLNLAEVKPQQGRYTFDEKFEYWALVWGTVVMAITGFMMWNPIASARFLPGEFIPAAKAAHGGEALLAILAILVWHFYHVHIKHFNKSMFTGYLTQEEMIEDHPIELADLKAGVAEPPRNQAVLSRRKGIFFSIYAILAAVMLLGVYWFITFEETAITTIQPAEQVAVYVPLTPTPFPTAIPTSPPSGEVHTTWNQGFGDLLVENCGQCHSGAAGLGGLDLSTYAGALAGGDSGPAIVPEDPEASVLLTRQAEGNHPGQFDGDELAQIRQWIEAGAPEE